MAAKKTGPLTRREQVMAMCKDILPRGIGREECGNNVTLSVASDGQYTLTKGLGTLGVTKCTFYDFTPVDDFVWKIAVEIFKIDHYDEHEEDKKQVKRFRKHLLLTYGISDQDKKATLRSIDRLIGKKRYYEKL